MKRRNREVGVFSMTTLDLSASALAAFRSGSRSRPREVNG